MKDVVIVGSGAAGLSSAVYAIRASMDVLVVEKESFSGGQIVNTEQVDNYLGMNGISGYEIAMKFREHADTLGVTFENSEVNSVKKEKNVFQIELENKKIIETKNIVIATGASRRKLGVPGEKEFLGAGVSYCATCDGAFYRKKKVVVVGGGDVAFEDALYLSKFCKQVYLVHRRGKFKASAINVNKAKNTENITLLTNYTVQQLNGADVLEQVVIKNIIDGKEEKLDVSGIFIAIGMKPETDFMNNIVKCDVNGYIIAGEDCRTNVNGIYVAGDVRTKKVRQLSTAVADGACAICSIEEDSI